MIEMFTNLLRTIGSYIVTPRHFNRCNDDDHTEGVDDDDIKDNDDYNDL